MYNPDYLERPYVVVLNKIDLPQASDRLPSLTEEILKIGQDSVPAFQGLGAGFKDTDEVSLTSSENDEMLPSISEENKSDKGIQDYPRPLAVVGVSVLRGLHVNEMLEEIRKGLRKCRQHTT